MNANPTLKERFFAETPNFWKIVHLLGLLLIAGAAMLKYLQMPADLIAIVGSTGASIALLSQFAVKDCAALEQTTDPLSTIQDLLPQIIGQLGELKATFKPVATISADQLPPIHSQEPVPEAIVKAIFPEQVPNVQTTEIAVQSKPPGSVETPQP